MGFIDMTSDLDNIIAGAYSAARGPVIRGEHTELTLVQFTEGEGADSHTHQGEQFVFVLEGLIRFEVGEELFEVGPGQAAFVPSGIPHATKALATSRALSFKNLDNPAYAATVYAR
jgi:quercetin dioxygenase-like cupin family protein